MSNVNNYNLQKLTGNKNVDVKILYGLSKKELLKLCQTDNYVFELCNDNKKLYDKVTKPEPLE